MPLIWKNGESVDVPEAEIVESIKAGTFADKFKHLVGGSVNVVGDGGAVGSINFTPEALRFHSQKGARFETAEEAEAGRRKQEYGTDTADELKAAALGGLRGVTAGLSDLAIGSLSKVAPSVFPNREELAAYQELNPKASTAGEVAGMVVPALLSGGATAGAQGGSLAAKIAARATIPGAVEVGTQKLAAALGSSGVRALSARGGLGAQIAARAVEGAGMGAASGVDTAYLRGTDVQQELTSAAGIGLLVGGALPAVGAAAKAIAGGLGDVIAGGIPRRARGAARETVGEAAEAAPSQAAAEGVEGARAQALGDLKGMDDLGAERAGLTADEVDAIKAAKTLDEVPAATRAKVETDAQEEELRGGAGVFSRMYAKLWGKLTSMDEPELLTLLQKGKRGQEIRHLAENSDEALEGLSRSTAETETGLVSLLKRTAEHWRELKPDAMRKLIKTSFDQETAEKIAGQLWQTSDDLGKMAEAGRGEFAALAGTKHLKEILDVQLQKVMEIMDDPNASMADLFVAADNAKRQIGRFAAILYRGGGSLADKTGNQQMSQLAQHTADVYTEKYEQIRKLLESADLWGDAAATAQTKINRSWTSYLGWLRADPKIKLYRPWAAKNKGKNSLWEMNFETDPGMMRALFDVSNATAGDLDWRRLMQTSTLRHELILKHIEHLDLGSKDLWGADALTAQVIRSEIGEKAFAKGGRFYDLRGIENPAELVQKVFDKHMSQVSSGKEVQKLGDLWAKSQKGSGTVPLPGAVSKPGAMIGLATAADKIAGVAGDALRSISGAQKQAAESMAASHKAALESMAEVTQRAADSARTRSQVSAESSRTMYELISGSRRLIGLPAITPTAGWYLGKPKKDERKKQKELEDLVINPGKVTEHGAYLDIQEMAPQTQRVLAVMEKRAPKPKPQYLLDQLTGKTPEVDPEELAAWRRDVVEIVTRPQEIVERMARNELEPKHVEVFGEAFPGLLEGLRAQYRVWIGQSGKRPSADRLGQLGVFLGEPLTGSADLAVAASAQAIYAQQRPQEQSRGPTPGGGGGGGRTLSAAKAKQIRDGISQTFAGQIEQG